MYGRTKGVMIDTCQLIFESLNSTGVALQQCDLIRNYVLMRRPQAQQTKLYNESWSKIEGLSFFSMIERKCCRFTPLRK